jgi:predicted DNA binding protein
MISKNLKYPIVTMRDGDKNIYSTLKNFDLASVGGEKFYKKLNTIVDSDGNVFRLKSYKVKGNAKFIHWLMYFQRMIEVDLLFEDSVEKITLQGLQDKIFAHVSSNAKHWLVLDTLQGIKSQIYSAQSFEELIMIFR